MNLVELNFLNENIFHAEAEFDVQVNENNFEPTDYFDTFFTDLLLKINKNGILSNEYSKCSNKIKFYKSVIKTLRECIDDSFFLLSDKNNNKDLIKRKIEINKINTCDKKCLVKTKDKKFLLLFNNN